MPIRIPLGTVISTVLPMRSIRLIGDLEATTRDDDITAAATGVTQAFSVTIDHQVSANASHAFTGIDDAVSESVEIEAGKIVLVPEGTTVVVLPAPPVDLPPPPPVVDDGKARKTKQYVMMATGGMLVLAVIGAVWFGRK